jgi:histidine ammonia-lyase
VTGDGVHTLTGERYSLGELRALLAAGPELRIADGVAERIETGARYLRARAREDTHIYGVNTGFGALCEIRISDTEVDELQHRLVLSHACGVGELVSEERARLVLLVKLLTLRTGHTGISLGPVQRMVDFWNHSITPAIPRKGTLGASGDLAPLAHMALPLIGLGEVHHEGRVVPAAEALAALGWQPLRLGPKEGLALINGVQYIAAVAARCLMDIDDLVRLADLVAAMSTQAFSGSRTFYDPLYHTTSPHAERGQVARNLQTLLAGGNHHELPTANRSQQDPYSFRCIPQVHGAVRQAWAFARQVVEDECNSVSDNPLVFPEEGRILFGGNLHGESTAIATDVLAIAVSELASISERRTFQLLSGERGLPDFLTSAPGLNSGMMIAQYTSAALVNENKVLATPASVDTIPTSQMQEDSVSMGGTSAHKLEQVVENAWTVLAIELMHAAQGMELNRGLRPSGPTAELLAAFRERVAHLDDDRVLSGSIAAAREFLAGEALGWVADLE